MEGAGAPLYETLVASFPKGLMPEGLEANIQGKIRKRLRDIGYRVVFPANEDWQIVVEYFAIAALDRCHRAFADNPWFWVVSWPSVLGAAAVDFWPDVGNPVQRRMVACDACAAHLESLLINRAFRKGGQVLPDAAIKGLRAVGQSSLPALPSVGVDGDYNFLIPGDDDDEYDPTKEALAKMHHRPRRSAGYPKAPPPVRQTAPAAAPRGANGAAPLGPTSLVPKAPPPTLQRNTTSGKTVPRPEGVSNQTPPADVEEEAEAQLDAAFANLALPDCPGCAEPMQKFKTSAEVYGPDMTAVCDDCSCDVRPPFFHCGACSRDMCSDCANASRRS